MANALSLPSHINWEINFLLQNLRGLALSLHAQPTPLLTPVAQLVFTLYVGLKRNAAEMSIAGLVS